MPPARPQVSLRAGFTMIELLVVISIIAILMSLTIAVYRDSLENARIQGTKATIRQLDAAMQDRMEAFDRLNLRSQAQQFQLAYNTANSPNTIPYQVAEIIVRKDRFRGAFPQRLEDLYSFDGVEGGLDAPMLRIWRNKVNPGGADGGNLRPTGITPAVESSALLYLALTEGSVFGLPAINLDSINQNHIRTVETFDSSMVKIGEVSIFIDEWDQPLRFYNWPTRLVRVSGEVSFDPSAAAPPRLVNSDINRPEFVPSAGVLLRRSQTLPTGVTTLPFDRFSHPLNQDPNDALGALTAYLNEAPGGPVLRAMPTFNLMFPAGSVAARPIDEANYHTLDTHHTPLIVSGGSDQRTGLFEPDGADPRSAAPVPDPLNPRRLALPLAFDPISPDPSLLDQLTDNLTNRQ